MGDAIKVLVVDDVKEARQNIKRLLGFYDDIELVGEAADGQQAVDMVAETHPDVILMDINMPIMDGLEATKKISVAEPNSTVIIISVQGEMEYVRRAMSAGARDYITKPFGGDELRDCIVRTNTLEKKRLRAITTNARRESKQKGKILSVYGTKGGVGKTTLAVNVAVSLAMHGKQVCLVDLDLQFGDVAVFMNLYPQRTIAELVQEIEHLGPDLLSSYLLTHPSGVHVLCAPIRPEYAEYVQAEHVRRLLSTLADMYEFVLVDTSTSLQENILAALDVSEKIALVSTLDLPAIKNTRIALEVMNSLEYPEKKIGLVMNKVNSETAVRLKDVIGALNYPVELYLHDDEPLVRTAMDQGEPFVRSNPASKMSQRVRELGELLTGGISRKGVRQLQKTKRRLAR